MADLETAMNAIMRQTDAYAQQLKDTGVVADYMYGTKYRDRPDLPLLQIAFDNIELAPQKTGRGVESWILPLQIGATLKETEDPRKGFVDVVAIISKFRNLILQLPRQMNERNIIRSVDSKNIALVPFAFASKKITAKSTLYGAGTTFNILFIIDNK